MNKLIIGLVINCFWAFVMMQRLCPSPPNDREISSCCARMPNPIDILTAQACIANYSRNNQQQLQNVQANDTPKGNCIAECIANQTNLYRGNGFIDRIHLARIFLNSISGDKEWGDIVASTVSMCINETRLKADELRQSATLKASFAGEIICHPISGYVLGCMNTELFKRCPNMTQSSECSALQQYSVNCQIPVKYNEIKSFA